MLTTDTELSEEQAMDLKKWEPFIQQVIDQSNLEENEPGKMRVVMEWRRTLAKSPHLLELFQIDSIMREVRRRITTVEHHLRNGYSQAKSA